MQKKLINLHYYPRFDDFRRAILDFFQNIEQYKWDLESLISPNFQRFSASRGTLYFFSKPLRGCYNIVSFFRFNLPVIFNHNRLLFARPGRHGADQDFQRDIAGVAELEMGSDGDIDTSPWNQRREGFCIFELPPYFAFASYDVPYLYHGEVSYGLCCGAGRKGAMGEATGWKLQERSDFRTIGGDVVGFNLLGFYF